MAQGTILKHGIEYIELFSTTTISTTGPKTLSANINSFDFLVVSLYNSSDASESKVFFIPPSEYGKRSDISWGATDSTTYYIILTVLFAGTSLNIIKVSKSGFSDVLIKVQGVKIV